MQIELNLPVSIIVRLLIAYRSSQRLIDINPTTMIFKQQLRERVVLLILKRRSWMVLRPSVVVVVGAEEA